MSILAGRKIRMLLAAFAVLCVGIAAGVVFGFTIQDADAARARQMKTLWAVVDADGNIARSHGNPASVFTGYTGEYTIRFNRNVSTCAFQTTLSGFGEVSAFQGSPSTDVDVYTNLSNGTPANQAFNLLVNC